MISPPGFIPHTVLFPLDTSIPILSMGIPSFLIKYCNASAPAYYDSIWFVTRTRHSRSNLLNRIFITRGRRTVYSSSAWLIKETVHPLPSHYNKNKHSLRGFICASGAMLILYQTKSTTTTLSSLYNKSVDCKNHLKWILHFRCHYLNKVSFRLPDYLISTLAACTFGRKRLYYN